MVLTMKRLLLIFISIFCLNSVIAQMGNPEFLKTLIPVERVHNFGKIYEKDGKVKNVFTLKNKGTSPVAISAVNTWCGCMVADYTRKAIRPGETANVNVTFDPNHKQGNFVKSVVLILNDGKAYVRLWIKANVVSCVHPVKEDHPYYYGYGLYMSQQTLPFPDLKTGERYSYDLKLANNTNKPMNIVFRRIPDNTVLKMPKKITLKPNERTQIKVEYKYFRKHKENRHIDIIPVVNGNRVKPLRVIWNVGNKFRLLQ